MGESISGRTVGGCTFLTPGMTILTVHADGVVVVVFYFIRYHMFTVFVFDRVAEFNFPALNLNFPLWTVSSACPNELATLTRCNQIPTR